MKKSPSSRGLSVVEIVIVSGILLLILLATLTTSNLYLKSVNVNMRNVRAAYLLEEGIEIVKYWRTDSWTTNISKLSTTTDYYFDYTNNKWSTSTSKIFVDNFYERKLNLYDVKRDASDDISTSTGSYDPYTKKVTISVSYKEDGATTTKSISTYITRIIPN